MPAQTSLLSEWLSCLALRFRPLSTREDQMKYDCSQKKKKEQDNHRGC